MYYGGPRARELNPRIRVHADDLHDVVTLAQVVDDDVQGAMRLVRVLVADAEDVLEHDDGRARARDERQRVTHDLGVRVRLPPDGES